MHGLGILGSKLEDITHLDTSLDRNGRLATARTCASFLYLGNIIVCNFSQISFQIQSCIMVSFFVCTCYHAVNSLEGNIAVYSNLIRNTIRSDITGYQWIICCNLSRMNILADKVTQLCLIYFVISTYKCNYKTVIRIFLVYNRLAGRFHTGF